MQAYEEGHIPYLLKFTCDLNIAPMGWIALKDVQVLALNQLALLIRWNIFIAIRFFMIFSIAPRVARQYPTPLVWIKSPAASWKWMHTLEILK